MMRLLILLSPRRRRDYTPEIWREIQSRTENDKKTPVYDSGREQFVVDLSAGRNGGTFGTTLVRSTRFRAGIHARAHEVRREPQG